MAVSGHGQVGPQVRYQVVLVGNGVGSCQSAFGRKML